MRNASAFAPAIRGCVLSHQASLQAGGCSMLRSAEAFSNARQGGVRMISSGGWKRSEGQFNGRLASSGTVVARVVEIRRGEGRGASRYQQQRGRGVDLAGEAQEGHSNELPGGLVTTEHFFEVPLDHDKPNMGSIEVFCRELVSVRNRNNKDLPVLLFLQGGPGFPAGRPVSGESGWVKRALQDHRVILLDQRGTGRSHPVTHETLAELKTTEARVGLLSRMRADSIVRDCEAIRAALLGPGQKWGVLGQSFGGFCIVTYLSMAPQSLDKAILTGGLPPVHKGCTADLVYEHTYPRMAARNEKFYDRFPQHEESVREIVAHLAKAKVALPGGGQLTPGRFLQLGLLLGGGDGLLERPWAAPGKLSYEFLRNVESQTSFETNPLYAVLHESIYCQGTASKWAADRTMPERFDHAKAVKDKQRVYFFGEHTFKFMYDGDYAALAGLKETAEAIATKSDWGDLYDEAMLKSCKVPAAAAVYYDDVYVERLLSEKTAALVGSDPGCTKMKIYVTNEYQHSGIRDDGYAILDKLLGMLAGTVNVPS
eukprot:CAMPEP_0206211696 /NCGR_PEP_ID=MMETSP0047_2-20121206/137_1 /ASSEMBLY_ACC=CAM_ASM_000192 /TAXON_ID=195065 /ORGANISM="Chroomonas mesostigmatica_cf, Strain CCMP1168" /LENGTH=540 /DNA_ID=CAMNT_0053633617 /DNA_START=22 /DNA_END=1645 /DNA_ORIENTATION=-